MKMFQRCRERIAFLCCVSLPLVLAIVLCAQQPGTQVTMQMVVLQPGGKAGMRQEEFSKQAKPGPGKELRAFVLANRDCAVSFAGFTRDGQLVYGVPETVRLQANIVKELPTSSKWTFDGHEQLDELDAVLADPAAPDYKNYADLVSKMSHAGIPDEVRQAQAGALREWIDAQLQSKTTALDYTIKDNPVEVGGIMRGVPHGQAVIVPPLKAAIVRVRIR